MLIPKDNSQLENARRLRREMTPHERKLWYLFLRKYPVKIYKQRIIGRCIVDFYCASAKLGIELDGSQHDEPRGMGYGSERFCIFDSDWIGGSAFLQTGCRWAWRVERPLSHLR